MSEKIMTMEMKILDTLEWRMRSLTAIAFTDYFFPHFAVKDDVKPIEKFTRQRILQTVIQVQGDMKFTKFRPSTIAASAILCASFKSYPDTFHWFIRRLFAFPYLDKDLSLWLCTNEMGIAIEAGIMIKKAITTVQARQREALIKAKIKEDARKARAKAKAIARAKARAKAIEEARAKARPETRVTKLETAKRMKKEIEKEEAKAKEGTKIEEAKAKEAEEIKKETKMEQPKEIKKTVEDVRNKGKEKIFEQPKPKGPKSYGNIIKSQAGIVIKSEMREKMEKEKMMQSKPQVPIKTKEAEEAKGTKKAEEEDVSKKAKGAEKMVGEPKPKVATEPIKTKQAEEAQRIKKAEEEEARKKAKGKEKMVEEPKPKIATEKPIKTKQAEEAERIKKAEEEEARKKAKGKEKMVEEPKPKVPKIAKSAKVPVRIGKGQPRYKPRPRPRIRPRRRGMPRIKVKKVKLATIEEEPSAEYFGEGEIIFLDFPLNWPRVELGNDDLVVEQQQQQQQLNIPNVGPHRRPQPQPQSQAQAQPQPQPQSQAQAQPQPQPQPQPRPPRPCCGFM
ncbi:uncharacterized protein LOC127787605 [Diospyros lotus]|uniref:uncharacterized protein LOC127787605 n=1 Tax=Diospyros lotus TaxID=55363 RepID=UPI002252DFD1|nr:uncharacterized protein LOC127787605 [Diospyros lotus]